VTPGPISGSAALSVDATGSILYRTGDTGSMRRLMWVGRNGKELGTLPEFNQMGGLGVSLSHDDAFVAWTQGSEDLWRFEVDRGISTPFTFEPGVDLRPVWEPAGRRVVYSSYRDGDFDLFVKSTTISRPSGLKVIPSSPCSNPIAISLSMSRIRVARPSRSR